MRSSSNTYQQSFSMIKPSPSPRGFMNGVTQSLQHCLLNEKLMICENEPELMLIATHQNHSNVKNATTNSSIQPVLDEICKIKLKL